MSSPPKDLPEYPAFATEEAEASKQRLGANFHEKTEKPTEACYKKKGLENQRAISTPEDLQE